MFHVNAVPQSGEYVVEIDNEASSNPRTTFEVQGHDVVCTHSTSRWTTTAVDQIVVKVYVPYQGTSNQVYKVALLVAADLTNG